MKLAIIAMSFSSLSLGIYAFGGIELVNPIFSAGIWMLGIIFLVLGYLFDKEEKYPRIR